MYEFKLRIHISGCLILALLLVILLCHFVPSAAAASSDLYSYNGFEFPVLPEVSFSPSYFVLVNDFFGNTDYLLCVTSVPLQYCNTKVEEDGTSFLFASDNPSVSYEVYSVIDGVWDVYPFDGTVSLSPCSIIFDTCLWSSYNIYRGEGVSSPGSLYLLGSDPVPVGGVSGAVRPVFTVNVPVVTWLEYNVGDSADSVTVDAVVDDGGSVTYEWYRTIFPDSGPAVTNIYSEGPTLVPDTSSVSDSSYYCVATNTKGIYVQSAYSMALRVKVLESGAADPPSETPTYPSAEDIGSSVGDAFQGVLEQNGINTSEQGNSFVDQITQIVPNESHGFVTAMGGLVDSLSYGGTECVLTVPALVMPQIGELVPQYTLLEEQEVDLESYFNMFPAFIVTLVQSLFTVALIVFCFKELYSTVSYFFVLRGGET